jgi:glycosyltransferase involved in cell wall biosynthesis
MQIVLAANARPHVGGQGMNLSQFVEALSPCSNLTVFCQNGYPGIPGGAIPESRLAEQIDRVPIVRRLSDWRAHLSDTHFDRSVARQIRPAELFQGVTGQCLHSLRRARQLGSFTILDCVTTHIDHFFEQQKRESRLFGIRPLINKSARDTAAEEYSAADAIRVMSDYARQTFLDRGVSEERVFVARPPLEVDQFPIAKFDGPRFRVSFVGLLLPAKGFHYLIEAFRNLSVPDSELILWGGPGHRPIAQYLHHQMALDKRIHMRPISVRNNYVEVYGNSHVLVHPSLADGYSYAVIEAMASGLPVLVTSCTGSAQLIRDGENGYVLPPRDPGAICERLLHLARNPELLRRMGAAARETIRQETPQAFRDLYTAKIQSLVSARATCAM